MSRNAHESINKDSLLIMLIYRYSVYQITIVDIYLNNHHKNFQKLLFLLCLSFRMRIVKATQTQKIMSSLSEQVYYIGIDKLKDNFDAGYMNYCRDDVYMRRDINPQSIEEKKKALLNINKDDSTKMEVLEPIVFEPVKEMVMGEESTVLRLISGNTRVRALLEAYEKGIVIIKGDTAKEDKEYQVDEFCDIPYRTFDGELSTNEALHWQMSTNDFTQKHKPIDIACKMYDLKQAKVTTKELVDIFKCSKMQVTYYTGVAGCNSDKLIDYVEKGRLNLDTAYNLIKDAPKVGMEIEDLLDTLWDNAVTLGVAEGKEESEATILKRHLKDFVASFIESNKSDEETETPDSIETDVIETDEIEPLGIESGESEETILTRAVPNISTDEFKDATHTVLDWVNGIDIEDVPNENMKDVNELAMGMLDAISTTNHLFSVKDAKDLFQGIRDVFVKQFGDVEKLTQLIGDSSNDEHGLVYQRLQKKVSKNAEKLNKVLNPESTTGESATAEEIELTQETETEEFTATVS